MQFYVTPISHIAGITPVAYPLPFLDALAG
jgi:hypothetical protein